jgi:spectinomycin phosphotransferase
VQARPDDLDDDRIARELATGWGVAAADLEYAPVGFGSHHWLVRDAAGRLWFATVDELERHDASRTDTFDRIRRAFATAGALADRGLGFVVAPVPNRAGEVIRRFDDDYSIALFPYVDGSAGTFAAELTRDERLTVVALLATLHGSPPPEGIPVRLIDFAAARATVATALAASGEPWTGGPLGEPARAWVREHEPGLRVLAATVGSLADAVQRRGAPLVVTHGEPHPGNVMRTATGPVLIDWDTVALSPPERDLWLVERDDGETAAHYERLTGRAVDPDAMALYRHAWTLDDIAVTLHDLRAPHRLDADTEQLWDGLAQVQLGGA